MSVRKTIAIMGGAGKFCPTLAERLVQQDLRLLFVSADEEKNAETMQKLEHLNPSAEIEFINCEKEGCWEADMIAFTDPEKIEPELVQRIKEVATQKIVLVISEEKEEREISTNPENLEKSLPYSRVVNIEIDSEEMEAKISSGNNEAQEAVQEIFGEAGYKLEILKS